jgi:Domain of unknown function (DUF4145)
MQKTIETKCGYCEKITHHQLLFIKKVKVIEDFESITISYMTAQCGGCKTISFLIRIPEIDAFEDEPQFTDYNFPLKPDFLETDYNFLREVDQDELPIKISKLYEEVKTMFRKESNIMAGIGLRMLVEAICIQQKISGGNLQQKINKMYTSGLISASELPILDKLRLIGNQSAHKIKAFSIDKLSYALDIINHILISIYILPKINKRLKV